MKTPYPFSARSKRKKRKVLFICTHNSARSQMAEGLVNSLYSNKWVASSAGTEPGTVNPFAIEVMKEIGIDLSKHYSKNVREFKDQKFEVVVTVCSDAAEACPFFPAENIIHHSFPDPSGVSGTDDEKREAFRRTRDSITMWIEKELIVL